MAGVPVIPRRPIDGLETGRDSDAHGFTVQWGRYGWNDRRPSLTFTRQTAVDVKATWDAARQDGVMDERTEAQLRVIRKVLTVTEAADIPLWLFGGWGLDARIGRITREHGDVEFWVERTHAGRSKAVLVGAGARAMTTQPPAEACEFTWDDVPFSTAYFDRTPDGSFIQLLGRWSDWHFPPGSFGDEPGVLDGRLVPAMSVSGMLAMKEQFPHLRNGRPWRQKDIDDIEILRALEGRG